MRHTILGAALAAVFTTPTLAADPASGTLTAANDEAHPLTYTSDAGDAFALTIELPRDFGEKHPFTFIRIRFSGAVDQGEAVESDSSTGDPMDATAHWAQGGDPVADGLDQIFLIPDGGTRQAIVNSSGTGTIAVSIALVEVPDDPGDRTLPYVAQGIGPRFATYKPTDFPGIGLSAAEPTLGINPNTGSVFYMNTIEPLRVKFDDATNPAQQKWESAPGNLSSVVTLDPIITVDVTTGRVFNVQLAGPISAAEFSDDDGVTWLPGGEGFPASSVDHQTLGAGPYPSAGLGALIPHPLYPTAIYYCSQGLAIAYCSRSDDGGVTFKPSIPIYTAATTGTSSDPTSVANNCTGIHGHVKVAPDGTVYVPNKGCQLDVPVLGAGHPGLLVSEDAGNTWSEYQVSELPSGYISKTDPSVAIGRDNTVYFAYVPFDGHQHVAVSQDHGQTWFNDFDVGAIVGIHSAVFPAMVAGDPGRAAVAFVGTAFPYFNSFYNSTLDFNFPAQAMDFAGSWHLYIASTLDYGAHWFVEEVAPEDLVQGPGGIGNAGSDRNLLDFNDATIDSEGRVLVSYADGCLGACSRGTQGHFHRVAVIARQTGGPRMYAANDPVEPAKPAAPRVSGYRTPGYVVLKIDADDGGSPISGYRITRDGETIATNYTATTFVDKAANAPGATYHYHATATNALGESAPSNEFAPLVDEHAPVTAAVCSVPGQLWLDEINEPGARPPWADLVSLGIAEPADQPGKLLFTVTPAVAIPLQGDANYIVTFDHPNARRYAINVGGTGTTVTYTDGRWYNSTADQLHADLFAVADTPTLDSSGITGSTVTIVLDKATWGIDTGDVLKNVTVRALPAANEGLVFVHDDLGYDVSQPIVGNDFCAKGAVLPPPDVAVGPVTPPSATSGDSTRFGGALGLLTLLPMLLVALIRRASRAA
ncbi:MAG TPA: sialidase family protein [Nevskiaceae bacterium]|nr:sialidase family protein [Nevskiaceae bacterium]